MTYPCGYSFCLGNAKYSPVSLDAERIGSQNEHRVPSQLRTYRNCQVRELRAQQLSTTTRPDQTAHLDTERRSSSRREWRLSCTSRRLDPWSQTKTLGK